MYFPLFLPLCGICKGNKGNFCLSIARYFIKKSCGISLCLSCGVGVDIHSGTVFAEKLETVISRNIANTCMRDFYDIYILQKLYGEQLSKNVLWVALVATVKKRGTLGQIEAEDIDEVFDEIQSSPVMENLWKAYQRNYSYADDLFWHTVMDAIRVLYQTVYAERNGTHD